VAARKYRYKVVVSGHNVPSWELEIKELEKIDAKLVDAESKIGKGLIEIVHNADALLVGSTCIDRAIIDSLKKCRIIAEYGVGYENIDLEAATEKGIYVTNVPGYGAQDVADHCMAMLLAFTRKLFQLNRYTKEGRWDRRLAMPLHRLKGKILGIIGFGKNGKALASRARSFGLDILVYDPYVSEDTLQQYPVKPVQLEELIKRADFISIHTPLTDKTQNLFNEERFRAMKKTAVLINTARGGVIDQSTLCKALERGWIAGAALDVLQQEPPAKDNRLLGFENVLITPHIASYSEESELELRIKAMGEVVRVLTGKSPRWVVDPKVRQKYKQQR